MLLNEQQKQTLREIAWLAIRYGVEHHQELPVLELQRYDAILLAPAACFVTLEKNADLRGCIGSLQATRPLVLDVVGNANAAAFSDPRFDPVQAEELSALHIKISLLSAAEPLTARSESELLDLIRPGIDGLILEDGKHRATFLPSVWEQLPQPQDFLAHLKRKAGLAPNYWSTTIRFFRYRTNAF